MKKRLLVALLATSMVSSLFAGGNAEESSKASETKPLVGNQLVSEPTELTIFLNFNNMPFNKEWATWKAIAEDTNVSLNGVIPQSSSNEEEAYNLMLSSGDLADIIGYKDPAVLEQLGRNGGLIPLNDLIDQHAPNLKKYMETHPEFAKKCYALDGNIYFIPKDFELKSAEFWWIRNDWLQKLDLEIPTTVDELYTVLSAFRNEDPNGNGLKDEVPLFDRAGYKMPDEYLYLWDTSTEFYARDGKIEFEPMQENFKVGVANLVKWYKEGLIDPEIFTRGPKSRDILFSGNLGGCTHDWVSTGNYNKNLADSIPGFEVAPMAPPAVPSGEIVERTFRSPGTGWGISYQCEDPELAIKFFDYFFSEAGSAFINWGIKGDTYDVDANGDKYFLDSVLNSGKSPIGYLRGYGVQYRIGMAQEAAYEYAFMSDVGTVATKMYNSNLQWYRDNVPPYLDGALQLKYNADDEAEYLRIMGSIRPYVAERFQSWMLGTSDFEDDYDEFISQLKSRGIERAIEINQDAYNIYLGN